MRSFFCLQKKKQKNYERDEERSETYTKEMKNVLLVTILTVSSLFGTIRCEGGDAASSGDEFCPAKKCGQRPTEIERWKCVGEHLFAPQSNKGRLVVQNHQYGWGNTLASLMLSAQVAAMLDARIALIKDVAHLWKLPRVYSHDTSRHEHFEYDRVGRNNPEDWDHWTSNLSNSAEFRSKYDNRTLYQWFWAADGLQTVLQRGTPCLTAAMPMFAKCMKEVPEFSGMLLIMPILHTLFSQPNELMVEHLRTIRRRLNLPLLENGTEPVPGLWGLYTPGYYLLALHIRIIPLGFEVDAKAHNADEIIQKKVQQNLLTGRKVLAYWYKSTRLLVQTYRRYES